MPGPPPSGGLGDTGGAAATPEPGGLPPERTLKTFNQYLETLSNSRYPLPRARAKDNKIRAPALMWASMVTAQFLGTAPATKEPQRFASATYKKI